MKKYAAVTICSINYIAKALVLFDSYVEFHEDHDFFLVLVDRRRADLLAYIQIDRPRLNIVWADDLMIPDFLKYAFSYDVIEFNTNVKPTALKLILQNHDAVVYLDPDIKVYSTLDMVFSELETSSVVVTPHYNTPVIDGHKPDDLELLKFGAFNLGFVGVSQSDEGLDFLNWWSARCLAYGFYEPQLGLGVDQKWVGLAPCFFPKMQILHDDGLNVAFWNLHERCFEKLNDVWFVNHKTTLKFIHFSSFDTSKPEDIAQKQTRFKSGSRQDFIELARAYANELLANASDKYSGVSYGFDYFDDGVYITPALRRFYAELKLSTLGTDINPFSEKGEVRKFAEKFRLTIKSNKAAKRHTFKDINSYSSQIRIINTILRLVLFVLGPDRYFNLMRYLSHISSLRNQTGMFKYKK